MVNCNEVFTALATALRTQYSGIYVANERVYAPAKFPAVWAVEINSVAEKRSTTLSFDDEQRRSTFEIQTFSNLSNGGTNQAREIMEFCAATMRGMYYRVISLTPMDNADTSIRRYVARFERIIGGGDTI